MKRAMTANLGKENEKKNKRLMTNRELFLLLFTFTSRAW